MTKKTIAVTVDVDAYLLAKQQIDNLSSYINDCLNALSNTNKDNNENSIRSELEGINNSLQDLQIRKSIAEMELKKVVEEKEIQKKEQQEKEKFKRWVCPVCKKQNFMEDLRCLGCLLPTRNDSKTVEVILDG